MSYTFHDINKIFEGYLYDLSTHLKKSVDHFTHLRHNFKWFQKYKIGLNSCKCNFYVTSSWLLWFIFSKYGSMVDPLKVEEIVQLPTLSNIHQLQSLEGKANFLQRFVTNYGKVTKRFMFFLKRGVVFYWGD